MEYSSGGLLAKQAPAPILELHRHNGMVNGVLRHGRGSNVLVSLLL